MLCALIMAGGKGTRFWPLSTEDKPKQFLQLVGKETMLQMTVNRILPIIPLDRIFICTSSKYVELVKRQLPDLQDRNIVIEPEGRNTAPCIALSSMMISRYYGDVSMLVLPSDHLIEKRGAFIKSILKCNDMLDKCNDSILTFGINPTRAETGYGYIKYSDEFNEGFFHVEKFVEKPDKEQAEKYLKSGDFLWNSGIFMWKSSHIINEIKKYCPEIYEALKDVSEVSEEIVQDVINEKYGQVDSISIDYAVLEKADHIYVIPSNIGWDDIGSWKAMERYIDKDENGNIHLGDVTSSYCKNNLVVAAEKKVIIDELNDIYVIENDGKIIVGKK